MNDETSTLSRWSKLKRQAAAEKQSAKKPAAEADEIPTEAPDLSAPLDAASDISDLPDIVSDPASESQSTTEIDAVEEEPLLTDEDMPAVETLTSESDISMFFNRGVSKAARNAAFKYLFQLPKYNIRDGLNDYDEDYTYFEPLGDTVTCDMKFHQERKEREAREAEEALLAEQEEAARAEEEAKSEGLEDETTEEVASEEAAQGENAEQDADSETTEQDSPDKQDDIQNGDALHADSQSVMDSSETTTNTTDV